MITPSYYIVCKLGSEFPPLLSTLFLLIYLIAPSLFSFSPFHLNPFLSLLGFSKVLFLDLSSSLFTLLPYPIFFNSKHFLFTSVLMTLRSMSLFLLLTPLLPLPTYPPCSLPSIHGSHLTCSL